MQRNPCLIQDASTEATRSATPLYLVHDGSGTAFSYYRLNSLGRRVYAICNPRFDSGRPFPGGIPKMAQVYSELLLAQLTAGPVLLGGWSLGGLIALEMASYLQSRYPSIAVSGVLMLDSGCPAPSGAAGKRIVSNSTRMKLNHVDRRAQMMIRPMLRQSIQLIEQWCPPQWAPRPAYIQTADCGCHCDRDLLDSAARVLNTPECAPVPPPVVLLKCRQPSRPAGGASEDQVDRVDVFRGCPFLGWNHSHPGLITSTVDLDCSHFDVFDASSIDATTDALRIAADDAERQTASMYQLSFAWRLPSPPGPEPACLQAKQAC